MEEQHEGEGLDTFCNETHFVEFDKFVSGKIGFGQVLPKIAVMFLWTYRKYL